MDGAEGFPAYTPSSGLTPDLQAAEERFYKQLAHDPEAAITQYQQTYGNVIDRDNVRELFPEYRASRESRQELGPATYRPAGVLADRIYRREVIKPDPSDGNLVLFNAGGPGVGKSTGIANISLDAQIIMDGTLSNYEKSWVNIQTALANGKQVLINYTYRPYEEALQNIIERAANRNNGRVVSAPMAAQGCVLARENVCRFADEQKNNPDFAINVVNNTGNVGSPMSLDELCQQEPENLDDLLMKAQSFVNAYFRDHVASNPALTEALRRRLLGPYLERKGSTDSVSGDRKSQPGRSGGIA